MGSGTSPVAFRAQLVIASSVICIPWLSSCLSSYFLSIYLDSMTVVRISRYCLRSSALIACSWFYTRVVLYSSCTIVVTSILISCSSS